VASAAPTTTTVLHARVGKLAANLEEERTARLKAEEELARTCDQLKALEKVLGLAPPEQAPRKA
jgi:hypothetical protein